MHDEILGAIGFAVPLLLLAWYANRIRHPERSWLSAFLIFLGVMISFILRPPPAVQSLRFFVQLAGFVIGDLGLKKASRRRIGQGCRAIASGRTKCACS